MSSRPRAFASLLLLLALAALLAGCLSPQQESDWRWKQYNPEYQPLHPSDRERGWTW